MAKKIENSKNMELTADSFDMPNEEKAWCPGCGNFTLHRLIRQVFAELKLDPKNLALVSGIGQAAKFPQYTKGHMFNGLHGRALPAAMAINAANPQLKIVVYSGDGCSYGEGGNHFIHQIIRNPDITQIVSNNQIYGLTKGQASPTSMKGMVTPVQVNGVCNDPFNPIAMAITLGASFVARIFVGDIEPSKQILKAALTHKGYALVDAFSPCVSFNKINTYQWYKERVYYLEKDYDPTDQKQAFARAIEKEKIPLGVFYVNEDRPLFCTRAPVYQNNTAPLYQRDVDLAKLQLLIDSKR
jgi:2-oxoglutarate/2-oxoacid ferredoxin oxidoreductase subunit beta